MRRPFVPKPIASEQELISIHPDTGYVLDVAAVVQDPWTQAWAGQVAERLRNLAGDETVRCSERTLGDLMEPGTFSEAVSEAAQADLILVSIHAAETLPAAFHQWVAGWVLRRARRRGALVALIGSRESSAAGLQRTREYLRGLAHRSHLDFLASERVFPEQSPGFCSPESAALSSASTRPAHAEDTTDPGSYYKCRWGINE